MGAPQIDNSGLKDSAGEKRGVPARAGPMNGAQKERARRD